MVKCRGQPVLRASFFVHGVVPSAKRQKFSHLSPQPRRFYFLRLRFIYNCVLKCVHFTIANAQHNYNEYVVTSFFR